MLDGIRAGGERDVDTLGAVRMHRDLLAVQVRGIDHRLRLVCEHLLVEAGADAAVDAARGRDLDDVHAATHLPAHCLAAAVRAVAEVVLRDPGVQVLRHAQSAVHVA